VLPLSPTAAEGPLRYLGDIGKYSIDPSRDSQLDSVNSAAGSEPPEVLQAFNDKLFVSPVVPALATHVGAWVVPDATAILTETRGKPRPSGRGGIARMAKL